jgi:hypothetical protein
LFGPDTNQLTWLESVFRIEVGLSFHNLGINWYLGPKLLPTVVR